jgi:hypothetical protein
MKLMYSLSKNRLAAFSSSLVIVLLFNFFRLSPLAITISYLLFLLSSLGFLILIMKPKILTPTLYPWFWIGIFAMIISIITCNIHYNQSFLSGIIANQGFYKIGSVVFLSYIIRAYNVKFEQIIRSLIKLGWFFAIMILMMSIFSVEINSVSEITGKVTPFHSGTISKAFTNFIAIIYLNKYLNNNKTKYIILSLLFFLLNHIHSFQRMSFVISLFIIFFAIFSKAGNKSLFKVIVLLLSMALISPFFIDVTNLFQSVSNAFKIFSPNEIRASMDISVIERLNEVNFAIERIILNPVFGNGYYRASEADKVIGSGIYFHESDIGIIGILYSLGLIGILLFLFQGFLIKRLLNKSSNLKFGVTLSLLYVWIYTLGTGQSISQYHLYFLHLLLITVSSNQIHKHDTS